MILWTQDPFRWHTRIRTLDHLIQRNFVSHVKTTGLDEVTVMHGWILSYLYLHRNRDIFQRDIEAEFSIGRSTVTNILQRMEGKGLICRQSVGSDARLKKLILTPAGIEAHLTMVPVVKQLDRKLIEGISPMELNACRATLNKLRSNVRKSIEQQEQQP